MPDFVNRKLGIVLLTDGTELPITDFFDLDGDECAPENAVSCVAGSDEYGWLSIDLSDFERKTVH